MSGWSWQDAVLYGPGWAAGVLLPVNWWLDCRFRRQYRKRWGVDYASRR